MTKKRGKESTDYRLELSEVNRADLEKLRWETGIPVATLANNIIRAMLNAGIEIQTIDQPAIDIGNNQKLYARQRVQQKFRL